MALGCPVTRSDAALYRYMTPQYAPVLLLHVFPSLLHALALLQPLLQEVPERQSTNGSSFSRLLSRDKLLLCPLFPYFLGRLFLLREIVSKRLTPRPDSLASGVR